VSRTPFRGQWADVGPKKLKPTTRKAIRQYLLLPSCPDEVPTADELAKGAGIPRIDARRMLGEVKRLRFPNQAQTVSQWDAVWADAKKQARAEPPPRKKTKSEPLPPCWGECGSWRKAKKSETTSHSGLVAVGPQSVVFDSEGRSYPVRWELYELDTDSDVLNERRRPGTYKKGKALRGPDIAQQFNQNTDSFAVIKPSHDPFTGQGLEQKGYRYPKKFQARERGKKAQLQQVRAIASNLDPLRLVAPSTSPVDSSPVVWTGAEHPALGPATFAIAGNGRLMAVYQWYKTKKTRPARSDEMRLAITRRFQSRPLDRIVRATTLPVIVRAVQVDKAGAERLAAASQSGDVGELTTLERAAGRLRATGKTSPLEYGHFNWNANIEADSFKRFVSRNKQWWSNVAGDLGQAKQWTIAEPEAGAQYATDILVAGLGAADWPKGRTFRTQEALEGAAPVIWTLEQLIKENRVYPEWSLLAVAQQAQKWVSKRKSKDSVKNLTRDVEIDHRQGWMFEPDRLDAQGTPRLAVALAAVILRAAGRQNPSNACSLMLGKYVVRAMKYSPEQAGMFGEEKGNPAGELAQIANIKFQEAKVAKKNPELTQRQRDRMPAKDFALPKERKFPIPDIKHARIAMAYASKQPPSKRKKIAQAVAKKFPQAKKWPSVQKAIGPSKKRNPSRRGSRKKPDRPQWVELGRRVDMLVDMPGGVTRTIEMRDRWRLATDEEMSLIFFVKVRWKGCRGKKPNAKTRAADAWESWTWGGQVDEICSASRPEAGPWRTVGRIRAIYYDGRLAEEAEGPARRVHKFKQPFPRLQKSPDGFRISRGSSNPSRYRITDRGIVG